MRWIPLILSAVLIAPASGASNPWSQAKAPATEVEPQAIGSYSAGCVAGAEELDRTGEGYQVMRPSRRRYFGHPRLVSFIRDLGRKVKEGELGTILVGDLSQPRGGPTLTGHRSHQTGLDVDIWYKLKGPATRRALTKRERERLSAPRVVRGKKMRKIWSEDHDRMLKMAAEFDEVDRIFVNPVIKKRLCDRYGRTALWLGKLRPWFGHADHFHVRLTCPKSDPDCLKQKPVPPGSGCDETLAWWFTDEARQEASKRSGPAKMPDLPEKCEQLI